MVSLTSIVRNLFDSVVFAGALAACGGSGSSGAPCQSDTDCKGDRVCMEGSCESPGGSSSSDERCGGSPLNGKYLWNVGDCDTGSIAPGDPQTCSTLYSYHDDDVRPMLYDGNSFVLDLYKGYKPEKLFLTQQFSCSDLETTHPNPEQLCAGIRCYIEIENQLFVTKNNEGRVPSIDDIWLITDNPYKGKQNCSEFIGNNRFSSCF